MLRFKILFPCFVILCFSPLNAVIFGATSFSFVAMVEEDPSAPPRFTEKSNPVEVSLKSEWSWPFNSPWYRKRHLIQAIKITNEMLDPCYYMDFVFFLNRYFNDEMVPNVQTRHGYLEEILSHVDPEIGNDHGQFITDFLETYALESIKAALPFKLQELHPLSLLNHSGSSRHF